jgi:hypothetical protein
MGDFLTSLGDFSTAIVGDLATAGAFGAPAQKMAITGSSAAGTVPTTTVQTTTPINWTVILLGGAAVVLVLVLILQHTGR